MKGSRVLSFGHMVLRPSIPSLREERVDAFAEFTIGRVIKNIFASNPYWGCGHRAEGSIGTAVTNNILRVVSLGGFFACVFAFLLLHCRMMMKIRDGGKSIFFRFYLVKSKRLSRMD